MAENDSNAQEDSQQHSNGLGSNLPMMRRPAKASVEEKPVDIEASPTSQHVIPGAMKHSITYFLRFARVITSFSCTRFLRNLAPTFLHVSIGASLYYVNRYIGCTLHRCNYLS